MLGIITPKGRAPRSQTQDVPTKPGVLPNKAAKTALEMNNEDVYPLGTATHVSPVPCNVHLTVSDELSPNLMMNKNLEVAKESRETLQTAAPGSSATETHPAAQSLLEFAIQRLAEIESVDDSLSRDTTDILNELVQPCVSPASIVQEASKTWSFSFVELWLPTHDGKHLMFDADACVMHPRAPQSALALFRDCSKTTMFQPGEGIPGRVWSSSKPEILTNVQEAGAAFVRNFSAFTGLKAAIGLPVICQNGMCRCRRKCVGVIVAFLEVPLTQSASPEAILSLIRPLQSLAAKLAHALCRRKDLRATMGLESDAD